VVWGNLSVDASSDHVSISTNTPQRVLHITDVMRLKPRTDAPSSPSEREISTMIVATLCSSSTMALTGEADITPHVEYLINYEGNAFSFKDDLKKAFPGSYSVCRVGKVIDLNVGI